jgi:hypothetical protein
MKLTLDIDTSDGVILLEKDSPLAPWVVTVDDDQRTCHGSKAKAIQVGVQLLNSRQPPRSLVEGDSDPEVASGLLF